LDRGTLPLFDQLDDTDPAVQARLPRIGLPMQVLQDYQATGLSLKAHPISFIRTALEARGVVTARTLTDPIRHPDRTRAAVAGLVLVRQRPATARGMTFMTLEDETGTANLVISPPVYEHHRRVIRGAGTILAHGTVQRVGDVMHLKAFDFISLDTSMQVEQAVYQWM
jgi:error-prone DNA polymerase